MIIVKIRKRNSSMKGLKSRVVIKEEILVARRISNVVEPNILPNPICRLPFLITVNEAINSGIDDPIANTKYPMVVLANPWLSAKRTILSTQIFAEHINSPNETKRINTLNFVLLAIAIVRLLCLARYIEIINRVIAIIPTIQFILNLKNRRMKKSRENITKFLGIFFFTSISDSL